MESREGGALKAPEVRCRRSEVSRLQELLRKFSRAGGEPRRSEVRCLTEEVGNLAKARFYLANQFEYFLIPRVVAQGVEVGVVLDPSRFKLVTRVWEHTFQQIESPVYVAK